MSVIRLENVTKKYEESMIFRDIYFRVMQGERIGLIGRNGPDPYRTQSHIDYLHKTNWK